MSPSPIRLRGLLISCATLAVVASLAHAGVRPEPLVPMPREVDPRPGVAKLGPDWTITSTHAAEDTAAAQALVREAAERGWAWLVAPAAVRYRAIELRAVAPRPGDPSLFAEQGYRLDVTPHRIVIEAPSALGRFYGVQTLRQLLRAHTDGVIPCVGIVDSPALAWRGISDDISRGQVSTIPDFKAIIRQLAYYKINLYQLYIEDMFVFASSPTSGRTRGALTSAELADLVAEGRRNHVVVSPIFETLAHQERLLSLKEHQRYVAGKAESTDLDVPRNLWEWLLNTTQRYFTRLMPPRRGDEATAPATFSTGDSRALRFVESLVDEIARVTQGPFFHIGGDEWQPPAVVGAATNNASDGLREYGRYLGEVAGHLRERYACRAMVYGDVILAHPEAAEVLPRDVIVVDWHYDPQDSFPSLRQLKTQGFRDVIVSPGLWTWRTFYPDYGRAFANVASFADAGKREQALGCIAATWGDDGAENLRENNWPGYAFAAAASWETNAPAPDDFLPRFAVAQHGIDSPALVRAEQLLGWQDFGAIGWGGRLYHHALPVRACSERWVERMTALKIDMELAERDFAAAESSARFDRDQLAAARSCARRYGYVADRELMLDAIGRKLEGHTAAQLTPAERDDVIRELRGMQSRADSLRDEFGPLWLAHDRPEGLADNLRRLSDQGAMLGRLLELAQHGTLKVDEGFADMQSRGGADSLNADGTNADR